MIVLKICEDDHPTIKRIDLFPCSIGRSMHSDVQLHHGSVSAKHAVIESFEDHFIIRDLGSRNGIFWRDKKISELFLKENQVLWIGDVKVELILKESLPKTGPGRSLGSSGEHAGLIDVLKAAAVLFLGFVGSSALVTYEAFGKDWPPDSFFHLLAKSFVVWLLGAGLIGVLSLFAKVNVKRFHFLRIGLNVFGFGTLGLFLASTMDTIIFNLRGFPGSNYSDIYIFLVFFFVASASLMALLLSNLPSRLRFIVAGVLSSSLVFVMRWVEVGRKPESGRTVLTRLGVPLVDPASAIDSDSDDLRGYFFRTIAEVDGERAKILDRLSKTQSEMKKEDPSADGTGEKSE